MTSTSTPGDSSEQFELDPVFIHSRREAFAIVGVWGLCLLWAVPVCYLLGFGRPIDPAAVDTVFGIPTWTFWGIVVPWLAADVITTWFAFRYIQDDDLGIAPEEADSARAEVAAAGEASR